MNTSILIQRLIIAIVHALLALLGFPRIVCLCGSTSRALEAFRQANLQETLENKIILTIGCDTHSDADLGLVDATEKQRVKDMLDRLHCFKVLLAHEVYMLNVGGYLGESSRRELAYARRLRKAIRWLEPEKALAA